MKGKERKEKERRRRKRKKNGRVRTLRSPRWQGQVMNGLKAVNTRHAACVRPAVSGHPTPPALFIYF